MYLRIAYVVSSSVPHWQSGDFVAVAVELVASSLQLTTSVVVVVVVAVAVAAVYSLGSAGTGVEMLAFAILDSSVHGQMKQATYVACWAAAVVGYYADQAKKMRVVVVVVVVVGAVAVAVVVVLVAVVAAAVEPVAAVAVLPALGLAILQCREVIK